MTKEELLEENKKLKEENRILREYVAEDYFDPEVEDEARINEIVAKRHAEEDRKNDERAEEDELFAMELRQIRYLESRYDDEY